MIRVFNKYGNRKNKNKARLKFVLRERGFEWLKEQIEKEYQDILTNGGIACRRWCRKDSAGINRTRSRWASGALLPVVQHASTRRRGL